MAGRPRINWEEGDLRQCVGCLDWVPIEEMPKSVSEYKGEKRTIPLPRCRQCHNKNQRDIKDEQRKAKQGLGRKSDYIRV